MGRTVEFEQFIDVNTLINYFPNVEKIIVIWGLGTHFHSQFLLASVLTAMAWIDALIWRLHKLQCPKDWYVAL